MPCLDAVTVYTKFFTPSTKLLQIAIKYPRFFVPFFKYLNFQMKRMRYIWLNKIFGWEGAFSTC